MTVRVFCCWLFAGLAVVPTLQAQALFEGDMKLSCEAVLCLSSGQRPDACAPSLQKYFSITRKKSSDTRRARKDFLEICPASRQDDHMVRLVDAIVNGAGRCDAASLNAALLRWIDADQHTIEDRLPAYCSAYASNTYTDLQNSLPRYVGTPAQGGYWVEPARHAQALREYTERQAQQSRRAATEGVN